MFCDACTRLFAGHAPEASPRQEKDGHRKMLHPNLRSFRQAKEAGCHMCIKVWNEFMAHGDDQVSASRAIIITAIGFPIPLSERTTMNLLQLDKWISAGPKNGTHEVTQTGLTKIHWLEVEGNWYRHRAFCGFELAPTSRVDSRSTYSFGTSSRSSQSFGIVKNWMETCWKVHKPRYPSGWYFPDRVLDIGIKGDRIIKLQPKISQYGKPSPYYATLSYCWGKPKHLTLKQSTLESFQNGINVMDLPRTMRQAVALARELGLRYLWIDALCIIQDSKDDWRAQSAKMGDIYMYSYINIAASSSTDSDGGLFFDRDSRSVQPILVSCRFPFHDANKPVQLYSVIKQSPYRTGIEREPLNARAWVFQERILAQRTLHCTKDQLFWECEHIYANESYPEGFKTTRDRAPGEFDRMLIGFTEAVPSVMNTYTQASSYVPWLLLVRDYSKCNLTKVEDILIALSGLARWGKNIMQDQYLAGLWRRSFAEGLLWHGDARNPSVANGETCPIWRAPSWSWASFEGAVTWSKLILPDKHLPGGAAVSLKLITVIDANMVTASADETGQLLSGTITLQAALLTGTVGIGTSDIDQRPIEDASAEELLDLAVRHGAGARNIFINTEVRKYSGFCYFDSSKVRKKVDEKGFQDMRCLPVFLFSQIQQKKDSDDREGTIEIEGILVNMIGDGDLSPETRSRVGYFHATSEPMSYDAAGELFGELIKLAPGDIVREMGLGRANDIVLI